MNKVDAMNKVRQYRANAIIDDGANGKAFEVEVKLMVCGRVATKTAVTSNKKSHDFSHNGILYEVKSGCGEIIDLMNGKSKADRVIYSPIASCNEVYELTTDNFIEVLDLCGLIRDKKTSRGTMTIAIQSFKNSKKKSAMFRDYLKAYSIDYYIAQVVKKCVGGSTAYTIGQEKRCI